MLDGPLPAAQVTPLLHDPPASFLLGEQDTALTVAIDQAAPSALRRAAATAAQHAVPRAQLDDDRVVTQPVDDHAPLGRRIRTWALEVNIAERVRPRLVP